MKKTTLVLLAVLVFCSLGCQRKDQALNMPTAASSGNLYPLGAAIANLYNDQLEGVQVSNQASNGGYDNLHLMERKEADLSFGIANIVYDAYQGQDVFKGHENKDIRIIAGLYYNPNQVVVSKDKKIKSLEDLKGLSFAPGVHGSTTEKETKVHLKLAGLGPDQVNMQYLGFSEAGEAIRNNQLDGAWIMAGTPAAAVTELMTTGKVEILNLDPGFLKKLKEAYPYYAAYTIKKGTYPGQDEDIQTSAVKMVFYTHKDLDDKMVYKLTKCFWENLDQLKKMNTSLEGLSLDNSLKDLPDMPIHPGALQYYREVLEEKKDQI